MVINVANIYAIVRFPPFRVDLTSSRPLTALQTCSTPSPSERRPDIPSLLRISIPQFRIDTIIALSIKYARSFLLPQKRNTLDFYATSDEPANREVGSLESLAPVPYFTVPFHFFSGHRVRFLGRGVRR